MKAERRAYQCRHDGCDSPAQFDVYVHIRYGWHSVATEHLKSSIRVCDQHRRAAYDLITSDHNKRTVTRELAKVGRLMLDWPNVILEYVPCGEVAWSPDQMVPIATA